MWKISKGFLFCLLPAFLCSNGLVAKDSAKMRFRFLNTIKDNAISLVKAECTLRRGSRFLKESVADIAFDELYEFNFNLSKLFDLIKSSDEDLELEVKLVTDEYRVVIFSIERLGSSDFGDFILSKLPEWHFVLIEKNGSLVLGKILKDQ